MANEARYVITIDGDGNGAIKAFDGVNVAVQDFSGKLNDLKSNMTTPYEHAGMYLFARQVAGLAGLADVTRHAMGLITVALGEVGEAAGLSANMFGGVLLAIGGAILLFEKFQKSHKDVSAETDKLVSSEEQELQKTKDISKALQEYQDKVGPLTGDLLAVKDATDKYAEAQSKLLALDLQKQIDDTRNAIDKVAASYQPGINAAAGYAAELDKYAQGSKEAAAAGTAVTHQIDEQDQATAKLQLKLSLLTDQMDRYKKTGDITPTVQHLKEAVEQADQLAKSTEAVVKVNDDLNKEVGAAADKMKQAETSLLDKTKELADQDYQYSADTWNKKESAAKRSLDSQLASIEKTYQKAHELDQQYGIEDVNLTQQYNDAKTAANKLYQDRSAADTRAFFGLQATGYQQLETAAQSAYNQMVSGVGNAFAKMEVEGKDMKTSLDQVWKSMEEAFISALAQMAIKWAAFAAMTSMFPGMSLGGGGVASLAGGSGLKIPGFAGGGDFLATHPTLIAVGESGTERVTITPGDSSVGSPVPAAGGGGGANGGNVFQFNINAYGVNDPRELADQVAPYIIDIIRGRGNLNFTGPNIG